MSSNPAAFNVTTFDPGKRHTATVRAARRRLMLLEMRRSLGVVKTFEKAWLRYPGGPTVRAGVVGAVR